MFNKKKDADVVKTMCVIVGAAAGVAALAAGVLLSYRYFAAKKIEKTCQICDLNDKCECHGKYVRYCKDECICEKTNVRQEEFLGKGESKDTV